MNETGPKANDLRKEVENKDHSGVLMPKPDEINNLYLEYLIQIWLYLLTDLALYHSITRFKIHIFTIDQYVVGIFT
jgi:hypothetical protein